MRTFFEAAIDSLEHDWTHKTLNFPIEWYTMMGGTTYQEVRLVSGMTALETLIDSNLEDRYKTNLDDQDFDELESTLISEVRRFFGGPADSSPVMSSICSKLRELNRVPFRRKLKRVMKHWQVPVPPRYNKMLGEAITARNDIVHRGYYYLPGYEEEQEELWIHVTFVRELLTRIIFSMLGYKGRYISYYGGTRSYVAFPPRKGDPK